jgi:hypothetical protein
MPRFIRAAAFFAAATFTVALASAEDKKADEKKDEKKGEVLKTIIDVKADFDKDKKTLTVVAIGQVPTGGWKDAKLVRRKTKDAPKDGIYEYDLTAVRPTGIVTQALSKVKAEDKWEKPPGDIKGVKVYGSSEAKTAKFDR